MNIKIKIIIYYTKTPFLVHCNSAIIYCKNAQLLYKHGQIPAISQRLGIPSDFFRYVF